MGPHIVKWTNAGTYTVDLVVHNITCDNQNSKSQSINVLQSLQQPTIIDYSMCPGESFLGYTDQGTYTDTFVSARGCDSIRILNLTVVGAINSTINIAICEGQSYAGYSDEGTYVDTFHAVSGCDTIRTIHLTFKPKASLNLGPDKELCAGDSLVLAAGSFLAYLWQDGSTQSYFVVKKEGMYSVSVTDSCGSVSDDIIISEKNCEPYFPNAFTPNNDGRNDLFKLLQATNVSEYSLTVYNRWGEKIFETNNPLQGWDGTVAGKRAQSGVFAWFSRFKRNSQEIKMKGTILLIR
jgi:gliding motility-associated-like protein